VGSSEARYKILKGGKLISEGVSTLQSQPGTTVFLRDIFFNLPVRRKLMVAIHQRRLFIPTGVSIQTSLSITFPWSLKISSAALKRLL